jgi:hypothetical protein
MRRGEILRLRLSDMNFSLVSVTREVGGGKYEVPAGWLFIHGESDTQRRPTLKVERAFVEELAEALFRKTGVRISPDSPRFYSKIVDTVFHARTANFTY